MSSTVHTTSQDILRLLRSAIIGLAYPNKFGARKNGRWKNFLMMMIIKVNQL